MISTPTLYHTKLARTVCLEQAAVWHARESLYIPADLSTAVTCDELAHDTQGVMGSIPWNALLFFTLYLQLIGMSDFSASMLVSLFFGAVALGNLLGGWVGDRAASRFPNTGRIAVTQFSVFIGIPLSWLLVKVTNYGD